MASTEGGAGTEGTRVVVCDINPDMLRVGRDRADSRGMHGKGAGPRGGLVFLIILSLGRYAT